MQKWATSLCFKGLILSASVHCVARVWKNCRNIATATKSSHFWALLSTPLYQYGPNLAANSTPAVYANTPNFIWIGLLCHLSGTKTQFLANLTFWEFLYPDSFTDKGQMRCARPHPRYTLTWKISSRSVYCVALWRRKIPNFAVFWTSAFYGVACWRQSQKVENMCTTANVSLSNCVKIVSVLQRIHGQIGRTISNVQKRDGQTDR